jgi:hypothetical protein
MVTDEPREDCGQLLSTLVLGFGNPEPEELVPLGERHGPEVGRLKLCE